MSSRNITLSMPDELVRRAKILAAQRDTSVSALVAGLLEQLVGDVRPYDAVWAEERIVMAEGAGFSIGDRTWSRDDVHQR